MKLVKLLSCLLAGLYCLGVARGQGQPSAEQSTRKRGRTITDQEWRAMKAAVSQTDRRLETKPKWIEPGYYFWWFFVKDNFRTIHYEPCAGWYEIELIKKTKSGIDFRIIKVHGIAYDLLSGKKIAEADIVGKQYKAQINGDDQIVAVSQLQD
jgi:hypothetical protein